MARTEQREAARKDQELDREPQRRDLPGRPTMARDDLAEAPGHP